MGISRKDDQFGFEENDAVPSCTNCSKMKQNLSYSDFLMACKQIYNFHESGVGSTSMVPFHKEIREKWTNDSIGIKYISHGEEWCLKLVQYSGNGRSLADYAYDAGKRDLEFEIDQVTFDTLTSLPCMFCGFCNKQRIGIDRIDSSRGYMKDNVQPACTTCNFMKKDFTNEFFVEQACKIACQNV